MKVLVCDDHSISRAGLNLVVERLAKTVDLLEAENANEAFELALEHPDLDLVLMDLDMPGGHGQQGLRRFRSSLPAIPVVIVSASDSPTDMRGAIDGGASGFLPKTMSTREMVDALELVLSGGVYMPNAALTAPSQEARIRREDRAAALTTRQLDVLRLIARGLTNREICSVLEIAENTVKTHVKAILEALDVTNRTEAALLARELSIDAQDGD